MAIEDAGRSWAGGLDMSSIVEDADMFVNQDKVASLSYITSADTVIVFFAGSLSYEQLHLYSEKLFDQLLPASLTVIDSYSIPSYLTLSSSSSSPIPSVRYLATSSYNMTTVLPIDTYDPPNLVMGLSAALASQAQFQGTPFLLLLFPSYRSTANASGSVSHNAKLAPETVYDHGGPSPHDSRMLLEIPGHLQILSELAEKCRWVDLGWKVPTSEQDGTKRYNRKSSDTPGYLWCREKRLGRREVDEGGMYM